jgi:penicillin-binding protein 2
MKKTVNNFRLLSWYAVIGSIFTLLTIRLGWIQLVKGAQYVAAADDNRFFSLPLPAPRGLILDRYAEPIVWNERSYARIGDTTSLFPVTTPIVRDEALVLLATDSAQVSTQYERRVAFPQALAPVVGYVSDITAEDLDQAVGRAIVTDRVGRSGLERLFNQQLQGLTGKDTYEINALGLRQRLLEHQPPQIGRELATTIDPYLSEIAYRALGDQKGVVIIIDAATGDILSLVNKPSYDAQVMNEHPIGEENEKLRRSAIQNWLTDSAQPFFNRATSGAYPPGSIFKMVTALAGLERKVLTTSTEVVDDGTLKVGEYEYANWYYTQYGRTEGALTLTRAIARSNDIYFYKAAEWVGPTVLAQMARTLGFGVRTGIGLGSEQTGLVPDPEWKEKILKQPWYLGNTYHYGIGQGDILVTPIQVGQYIQTLANQGTMCTPHITTGKESPCHEVGINSESLVAVLDGMMAACSTGGTAYPFFARNLLLADQGSDVLANLSRGAMACKTGTAEFGMSDEQGYRATHGWFVAMVQPQLPEAGEVEAPYPVSVASQAATLEQTDGKTTAGTTVEDLHQAWLQRVEQHGFPSRLVLVSLVESDGLHKFKEGSRDAAPVVKEILHWMEGGEISAPISIPSSEQIGD